MSIDSYDIQEIFETIFKIGKGAGEELQDLRKQSEIEKNNMRLAIVAQQSDLGARDNTIAHLTYKLSLYELQFGELKEDTSDADAALNSLLNI